jgi:hypothetical protein
VVAAIGVVAKLHAACQLPQPIFAAAEPAAAERGELEVVGPAGVVILQGEDVERVPLDGLVGAPAAEELLVIVGAVEVDWIDDHRPRR